MTLLQTPRLRLRRARASDLEALHVVLSDEESAPPVGKNALPLGEERHYEREPERPLVRVMTHPTIPPRVRAFLAASLDGFIAGPDDELDWLHGHDDANTEDTFTPFFAEIGAMLMGRRTFDVVSGFGNWPYGTTPVLVATSRPLESPQPTVRPVHGTIAEMIAEARRVAGERDVYIDGGALFRSALEADLVDELTLTVVPIVLGAGIPLFAGAARKKLSFVSSREIGAGMVQVRYRFGAETADAEQA